MKASVASSSSKNIATGKKTVLKLDFLLQVRSENNLIGKEYAGLTEKSKRFLPIGAMFDHEKIPKTQTSYQWM